MYRPILYLEGTHYFYYYFIIITYVSLSLVTEYRINLAIMYMGKQQIKIPRFFYTHKQINDLSKTCAYNKNL